MPGTGGEEGSAAARPRLSSPLLLAVLLAGCGVKAPSGAPTAASAPAPVAPLPIHSGYVNLTRYVSLHPAAPQLAAFERQLALAMKTEGDLQPLPRPAVPEHPELPTPMAPPEGMAVVLPDLPSANAAIRADYRLRRAAQPDLADDAYEQDMERIRRRFTALRREPRPQQPEKDAQQAIAQAQELRRLSDEIRLLQAQISTRYQFSPAQLAARRELLRQLQQELARAQAQEIARLHSAIEAPAAGPTPEESAALTAREEQSIEAAQQEWLRRKERLQRALDELEQADLTRARQTTLPPPPVSHPPHLAADDFPETGETWARETEKADASGVSAQRLSPGRNPALQQLREKRDSLRRMMMEDLRVAATAAGRVHGVEVTLEVRGGPDETARLLPAVREMLRVGRPRVEAAR